MRKHLTQQEKEHIRQVLRERLMQREEVRFAYLFGSFTLEGAFEDIDVAVYVTPESLQQSDPLALSFQIADFLEFAVGLPVDVVLLNTAPLALQFEATRAEPLIARDPEERADFVERVTLRWWDTEGMRYAAMM
jgi:predicted nucleotidyltransferase